MTEKSKVPEKIYLVLDEGIRRWVLPNQVKYYPNAEIIEYYTKSLHLKIKNDWFARGLKAGKISKNSSGGCCCVIEDDGETISSLCGAHKALVDEAYNEGLDEGIKDDRIQGG